MKTKFNLTIAVVTVALLSSAVAFAQKIKVDDNAAPAVRTSD
jgi:hypothetical protein